MLNAATLAVGLIVLIVVIAAAYSVYRSLRQGGCDDCGQCRKKSEKE